MWTTRAILARAASASLLLLAASGVARAQLLPTPAWSSTEMERVRSLAWGDADGDGDQDLAVAGQSFLVVYRNDAGLLVPAWTETPPLETLSVAWGDWDLDGDLDLLAGRGWSGAPPEPTRIYGNDGGGQFTPLAATSPPDETTGAAWGDRDGDGDLDVATSCGGNGLSRVYDNVGGSLVEAWTVPPVTREWAHTVAWADVDLDGDLDLAVGTGLGNPLPDRLFRNDGAGFTLLWTSTEVEDTRSLAWADWDGDGDPDLAAGNGRHSPDWTIPPDANRVYRNDGGTLTSAWESGERDYTASIAWGDWDGDGDPDLAVGNAGATPNRVYCNTGGDLVLAWSSPTAENTHAVAWGDLDGDGHLDLATGNHDRFRQPSIRVYLGCNVDRLGAGGGLRGVRRGPDADFSWTADPAASAYHLNAVETKALLASPRAHRPPIEDAAGQPRCEALAPGTSCTDAGAVVHPASLLCYQLFAACGSTCTIPDGLQEGP